MNQYSGPAERLRLGMSIFDVIKLMGLGAFGFVAARPVGARFGLFYGILTFLASCLLLIALWRYIGRVISSRRNRQ